MLQFRVVNYGKMLYESLRAYFSINSSGNLSQLYLFLLACLYPLQPAFDDYDTFRIKKQIIANCKWQIGQLTNVLNYFFDPVSKRITITQSVLASVDDPVFMETPINFEKIKNLSNFLCIFSDNDPYVPVSDTKIFRKELDAKIVIEHDKCHFTD